MSKVLIVGSYAPSLVNFRGPLIRFLVGLGHDVLAAAPGVDSHTRNVMRDWGVPVRQIHLDRTGMSVLADLRTLFSLWRVMRRERPDVVLAYTIKPVIYGSIAARLAGVRTVFSMITGLGYAFSEASSSGMLRRAAGLMYRMSLRLNRGVFFQNPDDMNLFRRRGLLPHGVDPILINGSGVDLSHYRPLPLPNAPAFLLVARLLVDKGIREYIEAARIVKQTHPAATFLLAGWHDDNPGSLPRDEFERMKAEGSVIYCGPVADVREVLARCRVYVLPSYREGTPRTVLEAMAAGRPIVTTDVPGCRQTVEHGVNGLLVAARDPRSLASAMIRLLDDPSKVEDMARSSLRLVRERFDVNLVNQRIAKSMGLV